MTFDPNKTIAARVKRRIVKDWRSRLSDLVHHRPGPIGRHRGHLDDLPG